MLSGLFDLALNEKFSTDDWIEQLIASYPVRELTNKETRHFYMQRGIIEYLVKGVLVSLTTLGIMWGGNPAVVLGAAALALEFSNYVFSQFTPSDYIDDRNIKKTSLPKPNNGLIQEALEEFRESWVREYQHYFFKSQTHSAVNLQRRIASGLVSCYLIFAIVHKDISLLSGVTGFLFMAALIRKANEKNPDYVENKEEIERLKFKQ